MYEDKQFYGHNNLTETLFVTQLSSDLGISVWRTGWGYDKLLFYERNVNRTLKGNES
jgi:hypothetical protein